MRIPLIRRWFVLLLVTCPLVAASVDAHADAAASARKAIQAQYNRMAAALIKKDVPAFMALCAPGFRQKTANAVIDREQLYEQLREMCEAVDNYKQETHIEGLRITAKEARVVTTEICAFTQTDAASELIVHHYRQAMHNRDIWVYIGKRWLLKYMETTVEN